jgi:hypothetical protein
MRDEDRIVRNAHAVIRTLLNYRSPLTLPTENDHVDFTRAIDTQGIEQFIDFLTFDKEVVQFPKGEDGSLVMKLGKLYHERFSSDPVFTISWNKKTYDCAYDRGICKELGLDYNKLPPKDIVSLALFVLYCSARYESNANSAQAISKKNP